MWSSDHLGTALDGGFWVRTCLCKQKSTCEDGPHLFLPQQPWREAERMLKAPWLGLPA